MGGTIRTDSESALSSDGEENLCQAAVLRRFWGKFSPLSKRLRVKRQTVNGKEKGGRGA